MSGEVVLFGAVLAVAALAGFAIGRWWALALVIAVPLASPLYEPDLDGAPRWFWPTVMLGPLVLAALAAGVVARRVTRRGRAGPPGGSRPRAS